MLTDKERAERDRLEADPDFWQGRGYLGQPLSPRQIEALEALTGGERARTYKEVAEIMGIAEGTLHKYLSIARRKDPELYRCYMAKRQEQLEQRHLESVEKGKKRRREYYYKKQTPLDRALAFAKLIRRL